MAPFNRLNPSPRYRHLIDMYRTLHEEGEKSLGTKPEQTFPGKSLGKEVVRIKRLIEQTGAQTILDYGSGKGMLYGMRDLQLTKTEVIASVRSYWGVERVDCYDPAYAPFTALPQGRFDGVVCTDVLEHCPEEDIDWILREIFGFAERFVYLAIACYPAQKRLPTGENAHITIRPPRWWIERLTAAAGGAPGVIWGAVVEEASKDESGAVRRVHNFIGAVKP